MPTAVKVRAEPTVQIIGLGVLPAAQCMLDVRDALQFDFDQDIYLLGQFAPMLGVKLEGATIYNLEPLYDGCRSFSIGYLDVLKHNHVLDYSRKNLEYLKSNGVDAVHLAYGFHPALSRAMPVEKDIDVLFVGSDNPRRREFFSRFEKKVPFTWAQSVYGADLDRLIARAKVHVNVHYCDPHPLEVVRLNYLMANGCTIISESGDDDEVNAAYSDGLTFARLDDFVELCHEALRGNIGNQARATIERMPHDNSAARAWLNERVK